MARRGCGYRPNVGNYREARGKDQFGRVLVAIHVECVLAGERAGFAGYFRPCLRMSSGPTWRASGGGFCG